MRAANRESVAAVSKDALRASASASVAASAASPATAAAASSSSPPPLPSLEHELAAVKQQLAALQPKIDAAEQRRDQLRDKGDPDWRLDNEELKQLRDEKALLLKEKERKEAVLQYGTCSTTGQCQPTHWPASLPFHAAVLSCMILNSICVRMFACCT